MRTIRTLVTPCTREQWDTVRGCELPPEIELAFLPPGTRIADHLGGVEILYGDLAPEDLPQADALRWVQVNSTGADQMLYDAFIESGILLTSLGGAITVTVAEHALALLFALARNLHLQRDQQHRKEWRVVTGTGLEGLRLGILGCGRIGQAVASRAAAFGMEIVAVDVTPGACPDGVQAVWGIDRLDDLLRRSDALVCAVPKTAATDHMIAAGELAMLPRGSFIVNISRGSVIDEEALVTAVRSGHIAGAGIDVTELEPCPPESPLWTEPNIILTPHSAGFTHDLMARKVRWFVDNLKRYVNGEPLAGAIDVQRCF